EIGPFQDSRVERPMRVDERAAEGLLVVFGPDPPPVAGAIPRGDHVRSVRFENERALNGPTLLGHKRERANIIALQCGSWWSKTIREWRASCRAPSAKPVTPWTSRATVSRAR